MSCINDRLVCKEIFITDIAICLTLALHLAIFAQSNARSEEKGAGG